ncbi:hypothetical protein [Thalassoglobus polymorphus]|uniref:Uncharacterized protein n=1 Tax=Thalassoglobus polymorphus TaxID=2527994 RepID=A0A517QLN1_9PLAN|nr:hypothetical protein [Thalassoglobus polymorphus]QDT32548.1 hypothetical protein Mal48_17950 [Thalassoglobus polymorphus]
MKLAAVASDNSILSALEAAQILSECEVLSLWADNEKLLNRMQTVSPTAKRCYSWDEILETPSIDSVLVSGVSEYVLTAAKQLVQAGINLIVVISPNEDASRIFELTALWQDATDGVVPIFVSGVQEISKAVLNQFDETRLGNLWKIEFERTICNRKHETSVSPALAQQWFLQDSSWLRTLDTNATHVTAASTGPDPEQPIEISIRLSGENGLDSNWKIRRDISSGWTLALIGEKGQIRIEGSSDQVRVLSAPYEVNFPDGNDFIVLDARAQLIHIEEGHVERTWAELIKLGEIGATASRSLVKRRTLPVHFEEASERSQFKSQMAAIGCGALLWTMFAMIGLLTVGAILDPRDREYLSSTSADFVIRTDEFVDSQSELTVLGKEHVEKIARSWTASSPVIIVEEEENLTQENVNPQRLANVLAVLNEYKIRTPEKIVVLRTIHGQWFETAMLIGWIFVFTPLGVVLLSQLFILASRSSEEPRTLSTTRKNSQATSAHDKDKSS